jgi:hypothetical protein
MKWRANPFVVDAHIIIEVSPVSPDGTMTLHLQTGELFLATKGMLARFTPSEGDYVVVQPGGYTYLNPKAVFEQKFTKCAELSEGSVRPYSLKPEGVKT